MPRSNRSRLSACYNDFIREINRLERFDHQNQVKFVAGSLTKIQISLLVESIFFTGFRTYEAFVRDIFILYCMEKRPRSNSRIVSYLKPKNFLHSEQLLKSSMSFLDWNTPDTIIERAEIYLANGHPIKQPYTMNRTILKEYKRIRNQIAHDSLESYESYKKVVRVYYHGVLPLTIPSPGEFLVMPSRVVNSNYILLDFFDLMKGLAYDLT